MSNTTGHIRFAVVMMVKDEADIIAAAVLRWRALGAEIYICDNGSTDGTAEILEKMKKRGVLAYLESAPEPAYLMEERINRLKDTAIDDGINWIIPCDPDETWWFWPKDMGEYLEELPGSGCRWYEVPYFDMSPAGNKRLHSHKKAFGWLTKESRVSIGNHLVFEAGEPLNAGFAIIEHFPVRTFEQMKKKLANHMTAFHAAGYSHPHTQNYQKWQTDPEGFFADKWLEYNF